MSHPNAIVDLNTCPACGAESGQLCTTIIDGRDVGWTHDARVYADQRKIRRGIELLVHEQVAP